MGCSLLTLQFFWIPEGKFHFLCSCVSAHLYRSLIIRCNSQRHHCTLNSVLCICFCYYCICSNAKWVFFPLNLALKYVWSSEICLWNTRPCGVKPKPAWPNCHVTSALFLTNTLGQPIGPIFKGQEIQKGEQSTTEVNWHIQLIAKYFSWQTYFCGIVSGLGKYSSLGRILFIYLFYKGGGEGGNFIFESSCIWVNAVCVFALSCMLVHVCKQSIFK